MSLELVSAITVALILPTLVVTLVIVIDTCDRVWSSGCIFLLTIIVIVLATFVVTVIILIWILIRRCCNEEAQPLLPNNTL